MSQHIGYPNFLIDALGGFQNSACNSAFSDRRGLTQLRVEYEYG